jgi:hypothetical protein
VPTRHVFGGQGQLEICRLSCGAALSSPPVPLLSCGLHVLKRVRADQCEARKCNDFPCQHGGTCYDAWGDDAMSQKLHLLNVTGARALQLPAYPPPADGGLVTVDTNDPMQTSRGNDFRCECAEGWTGAACGTDRNECTVGRSPCGAARPRC